MDQYLKKQIAKAEAGDAEAQYMVGEIYEKGIITAADPDEAFRWYIRAAESGYEKAFGKAGYAYFKGIGADFEPDSALEWYRKAIDDVEDPEAMFFIGMELMSGESLEQDIYKGARLIREAAVRNHPDAMYEIGMINARGTVAPQDFKAAIGWLEEAAGLGHDRARVAMAQMHSNGYGVEKDDRKAVEWLNKVSDPDDPEANAVYGKLLLYSEQIPHDIDEGLRRLEMAGSAGNASALTTLARYYCFEEANRKTSEEKRECVERGCYYAGLAKRAGGNAEYLNELVSLSKQKLALEEEHEEKYTPKAMAKSFFRDLLDALLGR